MVFREDGPCLIKNPVGTHNLRIDFALVPVDGGANTYIELDGPHHFGAVSDFGGEGAHELTKARDIYKQLWALELGGRFIRLNQAEVWAGTFDWKGQLDAALSSPARSSHYLEPPWRYSWAETRGAVEIWAGRAAKEWAAENICKLGGNSQDCCSMPETAAVKVPEEYIEGAVPGGGAAVERAGESHRYAIIVVVATFVAASLIAMGLGASGAL